MSDEREQPELAGRVRELEATVETLTNELVDATERIRELEAAVEAADADGPASDADASDAATSTADDRTAADWVPASEEVDGTDAESAEGEKHETLGERDDIIVA